MYKWVLEKLLLGGGTTRWTSIPSKEGWKYSLSLQCAERWDKLQKCGPLDPTQIWVFLRKLGNSIQLICNRVEWDWEHSWIEFRGCTHAQLNENMPLRIKPAAIIHDLWRLNLIRKPRTHPFQFLVFKMAGHYIIILWVLKGNVCFSFNIRNHNTSNSKACSHQGYISYKDGD